MYVERERETMGESFCTNSFLSCLVHAGKSRKFSLFKKTSSKDDLLSGGSGRFERSSGRGKRKTSKGSSSRDSSLDGLSSDVSTLHIMIIIIND